MISEEQFLSHLRSIWNSRKIKQNYLDSVLERNFLFVEGKLDSLLVSSLNVDNSFTPIAVSYMAYSEKDDDFVVTKTTHENRGKKFVIRRIKKNRPNEFGLVDMDHDYEQKALVGIKNRAIDSSNSMTLVGKIIPKISIFIEQFLQQLHDREVLTTGQISNLKEQSIFTNLQVKILSMQRFLKYPQSRFNENWECTSSGKEISSLHKELRKLCPKNLEYINDHDLEEALIRLLNPLIDARLVKRELKSIIVKISKKSDLQIKVDENAIMWSN